MPPKAKFTREEIVSAALDIVRRGGPESLTARELGAELKSSARPIFTAFQNMEEVREAVLAAARALYNGYVREGIACEKKFKGVGLAYIRFAQSEPKLFQLLFMREQSGTPPLNEVLASLDPNYTEILQAVSEDYGLRGESARKLYRHLWIYTHGIAVLCATKVCSFTGAEIGSMLDQVCQSLLGFGLNQGDGAPGVTAPDPAGHAVQSAAEREPSSGGS